MWWENKNSRAKGMTIINYKQIAYMGDDLSNQSC